MDKTLSKSILTILIHHKISSHSEVKFVQDVVLRERFTALKFILLLLIITLFQVVLPFCLDILLLRRQDNLMELFHLFLDGLNIGRHVRFKLESTSSDFDPKIHHVINHCVLNLQFLVQVRPDKWLRELAEVEVLDEIDNLLLLIL